MKANAGHLDKLDKFVVSVFVVILVDFDKFWDEDKYLAPGCASTGMGLISWGPTLLSWSVPVYQNIRWFCQSTQTLWTRSPYCYVVYLIMLQFDPSVYLLFVACPKVGLLSSLEQLLGELHLHCLASRGTVVPVMVIVGGVDEDLDDTIEDETRPKGLYETFRRKYIKSLCRSTYKWFLGSKLKMKGQPNSTNICPVVCRNCCQGVILIRWGPSFPTLSYIISYVIYVISDMFYGPSLHCQRYTQL